MKDFTVHINGRAITYNGGNVNSVEFSILQSGVKLYIEFRNGTTVLHEMPHNHENTAATQHNVCRALEL